MTTTPVALPPQSPLSRFGFIAVALSVGLLFAITRSQESPGLLTAAAGVLGLTYLPGLGLSLWVEKRFGWWCTGVLPVILSPVLTTAAALILAWSGFSIESTAGWIVLVSALAVIFASPPPRELEDWAISVDVPGFLEDRFDRQRVMTLAGVILILLAVPLWDSSWLLQVGEPAEHAAAMREVLRNVPPGDPYLAGEPLRTFWAFDAYLAVLASGTRLDVPTLLAGGSWAAALTLVFCSCRLLDLLALSHVRALWGATFLFFAWNGLGWLTGRPVEGEFFLQTFIGAGPLVLALVYQALFVTAAVASLGERRPHWNILAWTAAVGMLFFHTGLALIVLGVTVVSIPVIWILGRLNPLRGPGWELTGVLLPVALALLVTGPYLGTLRPSPLGSLLDRIDVPAPDPLQVLLRLLPAIGFGLPVLIGFLRDPDVRRRAWGVWALVAGLAAFGVGPGSGARVPGLVAYLPWALAAGSALPLLWSRGGWRWKPGVIVVVLAVLVPTTGLGMWSHARAVDPRQSSASRTAAAQWIADHLPPDAILVTPDFDLARAAGRRIFLVDDESPYLRRTHRVDLTWRRRVADAFDAGRELPADLRLRLLDLGAPLYLVRAPREHPAGADGLRRLYGNDAAAVHLWLPSAQSDPP